MNTCFEHIVIVTNYHNDNDNELKRGSNCPSQGKLRRLEVLFGGLSVVEVSTLWYFHRRHVNVSSLSTKLLFATIGKESWELKKTYNPKLFAMWSNAYFKWIQYNFLRWTSLKQWPL